MSDKPPMHRYRRKTRLIIEMRYEAVPQFFDVRGRAIAELHPPLKSAMKWWKADAAQVLFTDDLERPRDQFMIGTQRTLLILEDPASFDVFVEKADDLLTRAHGLMGAWWGTIDRLGVRFLEVLRSPHPTFEATRAALIEQFHKTPLPLPLTYIDSQAILVHERGRYGVGPSKKGDDWLKQHFQNDEKLVPDVGVAVDIDSYARAIAPKDAASLLSAFHDVYEMSLAVEESIARVTGAAG